MIKLIKIKTLVASVLALSNLSFSKAETVKYHADSLQNGTILHAFAWSFNTIKEKLPEIKNAGYSAVQTSPIQACRIGNDGSLNFSNWYFHYQPTSYNIGNYQLGSEDEFKSLCAAADNYGIKIIVDAVLNHMSSDWYAIDSSLRNTNYYHTDYESISDWSNRYQLTQRALLGLNDLNTQSSTIQQFSLNFLEHAIADGAYGFRYDAAKHIELPDDTGYAGNFWPTIIQNSAKFQYGEILQDSASREKAYANYIRITASQYGYTVRDAISNNDFSVNKILNYNVDVSSSKLITWVESHDTYANDECVSSWLTNEQIKLSWALIAARSSTTPLFLSRPVGGGGSCSNRFPGYSRLGDEGDALYKDDEIAAVNLFRNAMEGESEYLRNGNDSKRILMIERGTKGLVIINLNYDDTYLNYKTNLADGQYENQTNDSNIFTVSNGTITGTLLSRSVTVLYKKTSGTIPSTPTSTTTTIYFKKPSSWGSTIYSYIYSTRSSVVSELAPWPGKAMTYINNSVYSISFNDDYNGAYVIFTDTNEQIPSSNQAGFTITQNGLYDSNGYVGLYNEDSSSSATITIYYYTGWSPAYIHYQADNSNWTTNPGVSMTSLNNDYYSISIEASKLTFVFTNGNGDWDNNNNNNYSISSPGDYIVKNGQNTSEKI